ncbi:hypothetical protein [Adlercreutzia sp. ZJ473]|uniref:hypothetical protein n=1 Tax=Adlercreutzia sp. ZJ473 TaxID=2722822 RepID=UPI0015520523|nr:hypothetical protein [Adlercreutzia sp. ZJ473]
MGEIVKRLMQNIELREGEMVIADQDAGTESFGRGVEQGSDTVLIVTEPSRDLLLLAERMKYLSEGIGMRRIRVILNKVSGKKQLKYMRSHLNDRDIRWLGALGPSEGVALANLMGESLSATELQEEMDRIVRLMLDEAEMSYSK